MASTFAGLYFEPMQDDAGNALKLTQIRVYLRGTGTLASLYTDKTKSVPAANPATTDTRGNLGVYADPGDLYDGAAIIGGVEQARFKMSIAADAAEFIEASARGAANGVAPLDASSLVPDANIPSTITRDSELAAQIAALVNAAPATLDTLAEIAAALGSDPNLSATLTAAIAAKAPIASPTFTGTATTPVLAASGLTGAVAASRYVGATASVAPTTGTFVVGDWVISRTGHVFICTVGGTPGTWVEAGTGTFAPLQEAVQALGNTGSAKTIDATSGTYVTATMTGNCAFTFPSPTAGSVYSFTLELTQGSSGSWAATWPASVRWAGAVAPTLSTATGKTDVLTFLTRDGGATWLGSAAIQNLSAPAGTIIAADTFTRANSTTVLGSTEIGSLPWTAHVGTWGINTNQAYEAAGADSDLATVDAGLADGTFEADVKYVAGGDGLAFRATDGTHYILAYIDGTAKAALATFNPGFALLGASASLSIVAGQTVHLKVVCLGTSITLYVDGVQQLQRTSSVLQTATRVGFRAGGAGARWDNLQVTV